MVLSTSVLMEEFVSTSISDPDNLTLIIQDSQDQVVDKLTKNILISDIVHSSFPNHLGFLTIAAYNSLAEISGRTQLKKIVLLI